MTWPAAVLRVAVWPSVLGLFMTLWLNAAAAGASLTLATATVYPITLAVLFLLEQVPPARPEWSSATASNLDRGYNDGHPMLHDLGHTLLTAVLVNAAKDTAAAVCMGSPVARIVEPWITRQPFWLQCIVAVCCAEFGHYWHHRTAHTCSARWVFHAVHHSMRRLHSLNTGRFHAMDQMCSTAAQFAILHGVLGFAPSHAAVH